MDVPEHHAAPTVTHALVSLAVLTVVILTTLGIDLIASSDWVADWMRGNIMDEWQENQSYYRYTDVYATPEDHLVLEVLPEADLSRGAVLLFGTSSVQAALIPWEIPGELRGRIYNLAIADQTHVQEHHLVRYMVEHGGAGQAVFVFGLSPGSIRERATTFESIFNKYGLTTYDPARGIQPVGMSAVERVLRIERARCSNFLRRLATHLGLIPWWLTDVEPSLRTKFFDLNLGALFGGEVDPQWAKVLDDQMDALGQTFDFLAGRDARVVAFLPPAKSWQSNPSMDTYRVRVEALCRTKGIRLIDLSGLIPDEQFFDHIHPTHRGQHKYHTAMMRILRELVTRIDAGDGEDGPG